LGHILDAEGKKMSKSVGNVVDPILMTEKYGADPLRFWMYSVNAPGDSKNFDERTVDEVVKKVFNLVSNVLSFYELYGGDKKIVGDSKSKNVLDQWILARLEETNRFCSEEMDKYKLLEPARSIRDFISDLSQWYLRRSRERIKEGGPESIEALNTLKFVLIELAKIMAPFTPFYSEMLYKSLKGTMLSVHMESWTDAKKLKVKDANKLIMEMGEVRKVVSLALEQRAKANIKVRQPLGILKIKTKISPSLLEIIKDEVNVKNVEIVPHLDAEVALDISITPLLKKEGDFRELARNVQEFRKNLGLNPHEKIFLLVSDKIANIDIVNEFEKELLKQASLSGIQVISGQQNLFEIKK
jgi:isoleucyl-tRNA synthetase